jgi:hypothetical protein
MVGTRSEKWRYVIDEINGKECSVKLSTGNTHLDPMDIEADAERVKTAAKEQLAARGDFDTETSVPEDTRNRLKELGYLE